MRLHIFALALATALPVVATAQTSTTQAGAPAGPPPATLPATPLGRLAQQLLDVVEGPRQQVPGVEVRGTARDDHASPVARRPPRRLSRLGLRLAGDAAGVDDVQLGLLLTCLLVPGGEQPRARQHRVRLGHLAAEKVDAEPRHAVIVDAYRRRCTSAAHWSSARRSTCS